VDTAAQCRPLPLVSGVPYSGNQASMLMADGDATSLLLNSGCFLPPVMSDEALLASMAAANSGNLYPVDGEFGFSFHSLTTPNVDYCALITSTESSRFSFVHSLLSISEVMLFPIHLAYRWH